MSRNTDMNAEPVAPPHAGATGATEPAGRGEPTAMHRWGGFALLVVASIAFSFHNVLAKLSYTHGATVYSVLGGRAVLIVAALLLFFALTGQSMRVGRDAGWKLVVLGLFYTLTAFSILASFRTMDVSLAILIFYLFPIMVAFLAAALGHEQLRPIVFAGAIVAFAGLALALQVWEAAPDLTGLSLAVFAAVTLAINIVGSARLMRQTRGLVVTFHMMWVSGIVFILAVVFWEGRLALPETTEGLVIYGATLLASPIALISFYLALEFVGGTRSSMLMNSEPVITILIAYFLLGEILGPVQLAGAGLVILAIVVVTLKGRARH